MSSRVGFTLCSLSEHAKLEEPSRAVDAPGMGLQIYNADVHRASFVLPEFARAALATRAD